MNLEELGILLKQRDLILQVQTSRRGYVATLQSANDPRATWAFDGKTILEAVQFALMAEANETKRWLENGNAHVAESLGTNTDRRNHDFPMTLRGVR